MSLTSPGGDVDVARQHSFGPSALWTPANALTLARIESTSFSIGGDDAIVTVRDNGVGIPPESISDLRTGVRGLIEAIPDGVEVTLVTTAPQPRFLERATTDRQKLLAAQDDIIKETGIDPAFARAAFILETKAFSSGL